MNRRLRAAVIAAALALSGCAGYNLQVGTSDSDLAGFHQVYDMSATSLQPWTERTRPLPLPPPPDGGGSGVSTLPANAGALPPERPAPSSPGR